MKILCVSDQVDPLVYSTHVKDRFGCASLVLSAGDLPKEYLGFISSSLNLPIQYVEGNHDLYFSRSESEIGIVQELESAFGARDIGFRIIREQGLRILGLPGSRRYNQGPNQYSEFTMALRIFALLPRLLWHRIFTGRAVDIILTHAPPRGIHDRDDACHRGFGVFRWLISWARPRWFIHGHVHLYDLSDVRVSSWRSTEIINAFGHWLLDTGDGS